MSGARRSFVGAWLGATLLLLAPRAAHADLEPSRAGERLKAARHDDDTFCQKPSKPLQGPALALCGYADEVPSCSGFQDACREALAPRKPSRDPSWLRRIGEFFGWLGRVLAELGPLAQVLVWLVVAALVGLMVYPLVRALLKARFRRREEGGVRNKAVVVRDAPLEELLDKGDEHQLLSRAEAALAAGDYVAALYAYLAATLRALDRRGALAIARDRTNGEYVRSCRDEAARVTLRELVREVDRAQFGGLAPEVERVRSVGQRAATLVRAAPVALLSLVLLVCSCGGRDARGPNPFRTGDPAGREILDHILSAEGVKVARLPRPLGLLDKATPQSPPVLIDFARTSIDDDTEKHLAKWVSEGGVLIAVDGLSAWPKEFRPHEGYGGTELSAPGRSGAPSFKGTLLRGRGFDPDMKGTVLATAGEQPYAVLFSHGEGRVLGIASYDLLTNIGLSVDGNAAVLMAILAHLHASEIQFAEEGDGTMPADNPFVALARAGLALGLGHALFATLLLFLAVGVRMTRPLPDQPPRRRAFTEHVGAVGALYARARLGHVAVAALGRLLELRARARAPRTADVATWLAARAGRDPEQVRAILHKAELAKKDTAPMGDETKTLEELSALYAAMEKPS